MTLWRRLAEFFLPQLATDPDWEAATLKAKREEARRRHAPTRDIEAELRALRHRQLRGEA